MWPAERHIRDLSDILQQTSLDQIGAEILNGGPRAIRYSETRCWGRRSMVFVAHHDDVVTVLTKECSFSVCHYDPLYAAIAPRGATIIMRPEGPERTQRKDILNAAAAKTPWFEPAPEARAVVRACVDSILSAHERQRRFDLIAEYGFFAPYQIAKRVIGLGGPRSFSLLPLLICLANRHPVSQLFAPDTGQYLTDVAWSEVVVAHLLTNFENRTWVIRMLAGCGAAHLRNQIEHFVDAPPKTAGDGTLLNALWAVRDKFRQVDDADYREHVVSIMMELASTILMIPGLGFSGAIDRWLQPGGLGIEESLRRLKEKEIGADAFAQEQLRLAPPAGHLLRNATRPIELGGLRLEEGEYVCALVKSAGTDIPAPGEVKAGRCPSSYLHFGPEDGPHRCFGHLLAPVMLAEMFEGLTRLTDLAPQGEFTTCLSLVPGRLMVTFGELAGRAP